MRIEALLAFVATSAGAHVLPKQDAAADILFAAPVVALVEVTGDAKKTSEGTETPARTLERVIGEVPAELVLVQRGHHTHRLAVGDHLLAPLETTPAGRFVYLGSQMRRPLRVDHGEQRAAVAFVRRWRAARGAPAARLDDWIALTAHPAEVARRVGFEALHRHASDLSTAMTPERVAALAAPLEQPGVPVERRLALVRLIGVLGGEAGADHLATRLQTLSPIRVRHAAATAIGGHLTRKGRQALLECASTGGGALAERCTRILATRGIQAQ